MNVASLGLMAVVAWQLGRATLVDWVTILVALVAAIALIGYRVNSAWRIAFDALVGWIATSAPR